MPRVYVETIYGPQRCEVVREVDGGLVILRPVSAPGGPFGFLEPMPHDFTADKRMCWLRCRPLNRYGTRHLLEGRPEWTMLPEPRP